MVLRTYAKTPSTIPELPWLPWDDCSPLPSPVVQSETTEKGRELSVVATRVTKVKSVYVNPATRDRSGFGHAVIGVKALSDTKCHTGNSTKSPDSGSVPACLLHVHPVEPRPPRSEASKGKR